MCCVGCGREAGSETTYPSPVCSSCSPRRHLSCYGSDSDRRHYTHGTDAERRAFVASQKEKTHGLR